MVALRGVLRQHLLERRQRQPFRQVAAQLPPMNGAQAAVDVGAVGGAVGAPHLHQQVLPAHQPQHALVVGWPSPSMQLCGHPTIGVTRNLGGDALDGIAQLPIVDPLACLVAIVSPPDYLAAIS